MTAASLFAPVPNFRYVGLEPVPARQLGVAATAFGLGAGVTLAMSGLDSRHAVVAGTLASIISAFALRGAGAKPAPALGSARMGIVPWGVLVDAEDSPRILRWAAVKRVDVSMSRSRALLGSTGVSSRVVVETEYDRFVGEAVGAVPLDGLVEHLDAYAREQDAPLAFDLDGERAAEVVEPECEALLRTATGWLETARAATRLELPPAGYRRTSAHAASARTVEVLGRVLRDRTPKAADPRAFAAVLAAELRAHALVPELVALTQCPHPLVAAFARQAARKLGVARAKIGTLDEVEPFLFDKDRARLDAWVRTAPG